MSETTPKYETTPTKPPVTSAPPDPPLSWDRDGPWRIQSRTTWIAAGQMWEHVLRSRPLTEEDK